jgi:PBSX family phage terminase large subunit
MIKNVKLNKDFIIFNKNQAYLLNNLFNDDFTLKDNNYTEYAFFGGFRSGKSFLFQFIAFMIALNNKDLNILYVRDTYTQLKDSVITQINNDLHKYGQYEYIVGDREARFKNGSKICFRAFDRDTNILSNEYDAVFVCQAEDINEDLFLQILGRMSGQKISKPLLFCEGNPANTWVKRRYKDNTKEQLENKGVFFLEGSTFENEKNLSKGYIERLLANFPENWINRYVYGGWEQIDEAVFSEFREHKNLIDPVGIDTFKLFRIYQGMDYGWKNPTAILWAYVDYDGIITIFDEWGASEQTPLEIADQALRWGKFKVVIDYSTKAKQRDGRSVWDELVTQGLWLTESNKDEFSNIVLVNTLFKLNRLKITKNCVGLLKELKNYKWKRVKLGEDKNHQETPVDKDNHFIDSMLYLISDLEGKETENPKQKEYNQSLEFKTTQVNEWNEDILGGMS